jgi:gamma-glutamyltranspeptidase/glutathione hydrolase
MPNFADFMESLAKEGKDLFYKGEIAASIANDCSEFGGFLCYEDFANYKVYVRKPLNYHFHDTHILLPGFPSLGGGLMVVFLDQIKDADTEYDFLSIEHLNALYKAEKYCDKFKRNPLKLQTAVIEILKDLPDSFIKNLIKLGGTTHLNVVDKDNNAVSLTTSIGEGCGYMIKNTDMMMNNMMGESALLPDGLHSWTANKRLYSMMTPTIIINKEGRAELSLGSGGAGRIPFMIAQVLTNYLLYGKDLHESVNSPRVHYGHGIFNIEKGFEEGKINVDSDTTIQNWDTSLFFGGVHSISVEGDTYDAVGDERRDGVSIVNEK